jgi:D-glutamate cyclase
MSDPRLTAIRDVVQEDAGNRGLRTDPASNLVSACPDDFEAACRSLAGAERPALGIVTGFFIPYAEPPCGETDGPLGALFLARALVPLGVKVVLATDAFCARALEVGLAVAGLRKAVPLITLPSYEAACSLSVGDYGQWFAGRAGPLTHLLALERVGPSHTADSVGQQPGATDALVEEFRAEVPAERQDRCHTMRGRDITARMSPAHRLFEEAGRPGPGLVTLGIGDGGNEVGMGKIAWDVIRRNIPRGGLVACRVPADHLIVCGVSNWGAYGLAAGVRLLRGRGPEADLFDVGRERELLAAMVEGGPLVDGVLGEPAVSVDGLDFDRYAEPLRRLAEIA